MTIQEAKETLAPYSVRLFKNQEGDFMVQFETQRYFAKDLLDAVETGLEMRYKKPARSSR
jgi:hypothetical protein